MSVAELSPLFMFASVFASASAAFDILGLSALSVSFVVCKLYLCLVCNFFRLFVMFVPRSDLLWLVCYICPLFTSTIIACLLCICLVNFFFRSSAISSYTRVICSVCVRLCLCLVWPLYLRLLWLAPSISSVACPVYVCFICALFVFFVAYLCCPLCLHLGWLVLSMSAVPIPYLYLLWLVYFTYIWVFFFVMSAWLLVCFFIFML